MKIVVTGGAGFIGSALVRHLIDRTRHEVMVIDKLTYSGNRTSLGPCGDSPRLQFCEADIADGRRLHELFTAFRPDAVMHLAAETHVDRSIEDPAPFITTNLVGTYTLLEATRHYLARTGHDHFRFLQVSTDEVYGDLDDDGYFVETSPYAPSSPYSASKAGADHLAKAWHRTFCLPVVVSNCSNNYGPYHHPEKLIPHLIISALHGRELPIYGAGTQVRDWLFVDDHVDALFRILAHGRPGETYNVGGNSPLPNIEVARAVCRQLEALAPDRPAGVGHYHELIRHVPDRPGHDRRYAIDCGKLRRELGWAPALSFEDGLAWTVRWYLDNRDWWQAILDERYRLTRLGTAAVGQPT